MSDQQQVLQQQFGQIFQPDATSFSQPQMHSFNYDEQTNQLQQQQQILLDQDYSSDSITANYNLNSESALDTIRKQNMQANQGFTYPIDGNEQSENNIEYEETNGQRNPTSYLKNMGDGISTKFYTTLPSREAAEKLAALAAAGNVNSRLIGQLRKQQVKNTRDKDEPIPSNHKNDNEVNREQADDSRQQQKYDQRQSYHKSQLDRNQKYEAQNDEKLPLQITVLDESDYVTGDRQSDTRQDHAVDVEYEYDDEEIENSKPSTPLNVGAASHESNSEVEFGTRLRSKPKE